MLKKYRIVKLIYENRLVGMKETWALQKRVGMFFWVTVSKCDSKEQCKTFWKNTKDLQREKVVRVVEQL